MISSSIMEFLTRSSDGIEKLYRPTWLKNEPRENNWLIIFDLNPAAISTLDKHKRPKATPLNWSLPLLEGDLTSGRYTVLLVQMKLLLLAFVDLGVAPSRTPAQLVHFHKSLMLLATQCDAHSTELTVSLGLGAANADTVLEVLTKYQADGAEGVWDFRTKWDNWIKQELEGVPASEFLSWDAQATIAHTVLLQARRNGVTSLDPAGVAAVPSTVDADLLRRATLLLLNRGAFDSSGFIRPAFVAQALKTETSRVIRSDAFVYHIRQYELAHDYCLKEFRKYGVRSTPIAGKLTLAERANVKDGYLTQTLANGLILVSRAASLVASLRGSDLACTADIADAVESFTHKSPARTLSVPLKSGLALIRCTADWQDRYGQPLLELARHISDSLPNSVGGLTRRLGASAKEKIYVPAGSQLDDFKLSEFWGHAHKTEVATWSGSARQPGTGVNWRKSLAFCDLVEIYTATVFVLTTLFACCRKQEVSELVDSDLFERRGRWYLKCYLRKKGVDGVRKKIAKPIPNIVADSLRCLSSIRDSLLRLTRDRITTVEPTIFFRLTRSAITRLHSSDLYNMLDMFSEFHGLNVEDIPWHVRPHQLRRFFALTFFHFGGKENSLPALSWFMGHEGDVERTWRYIMEELRGEEISAAEASMAAMAIYSKQETNAAETLRHLLLKYFQVESLDVMSDREVEDYLTYLHSQGKFTAKPICVRTKDGMRHDVLIHIKV